MIEENFQFGHRLEVLFDHGHRHGPGIARDIVGAGQDDYCGGLQVDHVGEHADQHLRSGLTADAAVDVRLAGERLIQVPSNGDGISHEDDALGIGGLLLEFLVGGVELAEHVPVAELIRQALRGARQTALAARALEVIHGLGPGRGGKQ